MESTSLRVCGGQSTRTRGAGGSDATGDELAEDGFGDEASSRGRCGRRRDDRHERITLRYVERRGCGVEDGVRPDACDRLDARPLLDEVEGSLAAGTRVFRVQERVNPPVEVVAARDRARSARRRDGTDVR